YLTALPPSPPSPRFPYTTLFRSGGPGTHLVGVLAGVVLHRERRAAVGVAFAQHRIHGAALDLVVAGLDVLLAVAGRLFRVVGQRSEEHTSELQSRENLVCRLLLE